MLVCVTTQRSCERLIREGLRETGGAEGFLRVLHVTGSGRSILGAEDEPSALEYLFRVSGESGADMRMVRSDDLIASITAEAKDFGAEMVLLGASRHQARGRHIAEKLRMNLPGLEIREILTNED